MFMSRPCSGSVTHLEEVDVARGDEVGVLAAERREVIEDYGDDQVEEDEARNDLAVCDGGA